MAMPVTLEGKDLAGNAYTEATQTVVINRSGCKVMAATPLTMKDRLTLRVGKGPRVTDAAVVWIGEKKGAKTEIGLDIAHNDGTFWGVLFPDESGAPSTATFSKMGPAPVLPAQVPTKPVTPTSPTSAVSTTPQTPASTPPPSAPGSAAPAMKGPASLPSPAPRTSGVQSSSSSSSVKRELSIDFQRGQEMLDEHVAEVVENAQKEIRVRVRETMQQSMREAFTAAVNSAKEDLEILSQQHAQQVLKGIEGISRASERTAMALEQRALSSALNTQTIMEQRFHAKLTECNVAINNVLQQAVDQLSQRVQAQIQQVEESWKKKLDEFVEERIEGYISAQTAQLMIRSQEMMESQMQEFAERLRNEANSIVQSVTKKSPTHKSDKNIV